MVRSLQDLEGRDNVIYQRSANTAWRTIVGETIVVHLHAKEFFGLNETAADLWNALDGTADLGVLSARFGIPPAEVAAFCAELQELGLVEVVEEDEAPSEVSPGSEKPLSGGPQTEVVDPPRIVWREEIRQVASSCAFISGANPLCNQVPSS
jgi:hypothetical protein